MHVVDRLVPPPADLERTAGAVLTVDLSAIADNYRLLCREAGASECAAVVKADAYGLGAGRVVPTLEAAGCRTFFVAHVSEGVALRGIVGPDVEVVILNGLTPGSEDACRAHRIVPVLNDDAQRAAWRALAVRHGERLPAVLQVDSGMARFGFAVADLLGLLNDPLAFDGIDLRLVMSHLACADEPDNPINVAQLTAFRDVRRRLPGIRASLAASSGIFLGGDYHFDMVRPGAALFGIAPRAGRTNPMRPVVGLRGRVVQVRSVPTGTPVGYGHTAVTGRDSRLATVAVGYADGFLRSASGVGAAWFAGNRLPIIGRVSMDSIVLDATELRPDALGPGALVDIIGPDRDVDAVAAAAGTIGYEVLTGLGHRFHRTYLAT